MILFWGTVSVPIGYTVHCKGRSRVEQGAAARVDNITWQKEQSMPGYRLNKIKCSFHLKFKIQVVHV